MDLLQCQKSETFSDRMFSDSCFGTQNLKRTGTVTPSLELVRLALVLGDSLYILF